MPEAKGLLIKVCGMGSSENMRATDQLEIDFLGFIFHADSPRNLTDEKLLSITTKAEKVLVTRDMAAEKLIALAKRNAIQWLQLHGNESIENCIEYKRLGFRLIKNIAIGKASDFDKAICFQEIVDSLLFDTSSQRGGGSGQQFDWKWLKNYSGKTKFFLSGGISPEHAKAISKLYHPALAGIDLNSRFEISPGQKNITSLKQFLDELQYNEPAKQSSGQ